MKRTLACILCAVILLTLTACSGAPLPESLPVPTDELVVYVPPMLMNREEIGKAAELFERKYPEIELRMVEFDPAISLGAVYGEVDNTIVEEYVTLLASELNAGAGPDVILFHTGDGELSDIYKAMRSGVFCDLNPFMEADEEFDVGDYTAGVFDCGVLNGERLFVPISYHVIGVAVMREYLEAAGLTLPDKPDFAAFDALLRGGVRSGEGDRLLAYPFLATAWLEDSGLRTVDYETGEILVDTDEFRAVIEQVKMLYPYRFQEEIYLRSTGEGMANVVAGRALIQVDGVDDVNGVGFLRFYESASRPSIFTRPAVDGKAVAEPELLAGIRATSPNRANAYAFVKILLSMEAQEKIATIPVRTETLRKYLTHDSMYEATTDQNGAPLYALTEDETDRLFEAFTDVRPSSDFGINVIHIVAEHMTPYWEGHTSYEDCAAQLKNYLEIYIYE